MSLVSFVGDRRRFPGQSPEVIVKREATKKANRDGEVKRLYYTISEAGGQIGIAPSHIRYLEGLFSLPAKRTTKGIRQYTASDIERLKTVYGLSLCLYPSVVKDLISNKVDLEEVLLYIQRKIYNP